MKSTSIEISLVEVSFNRNKENINLTSVLEGHLSVRFRIVNIRQSNDSQENDTERERNFKIRKLHSNIKKGVKN